ncbi:hypothetical protein [Mesorhizobium sp. M0138]|uniref:hypothetical protein n=1 Tax=Mesorhizobium sp. M0138 TaxID=2956891 RepID=UPI003336F94E
MPKLDIATSAIAATAAVPFVARETVSALTTAGGVLEILGVWSHLMKAQVFPHVDMSVNRTLANTYQKRLLSQHAMSVLLIAWKESDQVSDAEINAAGAERIGTSCAPINCHNLAKRMATDVGDFDRQEKIIQGIIKAAEAYGLIAREQFKNTRQRALRGTERLHALMLSFDDKVRPICGDIAASGLGGL